MIKTMMAASVIIVLTALFLCMSLAIVVMALDGTEIYHEIDRRIANKLKRRRRNND